MSLDQQALSQIVRFDPAQLQSGDVLLMRGAGDFSTLIAWFGDSIYSHAAFLADDATLYESITKGITATPLSQRITAYDKVVFIDAYRPLSNDLSPLTQTDRDLVVAQGKQFLGRPYAMDDLFMIGVLVAVRDKTLPVQDVRLRWLLHEALDHVMNSSDQKMVCSEFVYRCFAENAATPTGRLAPQIVLSPPTDAPFPKIDWVELWKEIWPLLRPQRQAALASVGANALAAPPQGLSDKALTAVAAPELDDDEFAQAKAAVRAQLGLAQPVPLMANAVGGIGEPRPFPHPNPKMVTPHDLEMTPSHTRLGRIMQAPAGQGG